MTCPFSKFKQHVEMQGFLFVDEYFVVVGKDSDYYINCNGFNKLDDNMTIACNLVNNVWYFKVVALAATSFNHIGDSHHKRSYTASNTDIIWSGLELLAFYYIHHPEECCGKQYHSILKAYNKVYKTPVNIILGELIK